MLHGDVVAPLFSDKTLDVVLFSDKTRMLYFEVLASAFFYILVLVSRGLCFNVVTVKHCEALTLTVARLWL